MKIEDTKNRLKRAIKDGSDLCGLSYTDELLNLCANFVTNKYPSIEPNELFIMFENKALTGDVSVYKLSASFISSLINYKNRFKIK